MVPARRALLLWVHSGRPVAGGGFNWIEIYLSHNRPDCLLSARLGLVTQSPPSAPVEMSTTHSVIGTSSVMMTRPRLMAGAGSVRCVYCLRPRRRHCRSDRCCVSRTDAIRTIAVQCN